MIPDPYEPLKWLLVLFLLIMIVWLLMAVPDQGLMYPPKPDDLLGQLIAHACHASN